MLNLSNKVGLESREARWEVHLIRLFCRPAPVFAFAPFFVPRPSVGGAEYRLSRLVRRASGAALVALIVGRAAAADPAWEAGLEAARELKITEASRLLAGEGPVGSPREGVSRALGLMADPVRSMAKFAEARQLLQQAEESGGDVAALAAYLQARLTQTELAGNDPAAVMAAYERVRRAYPDSVYADHAFVFQAITRHYAPIALAEKRTVLEELDREAEGTLRTAVGRRLYHLAAGLAWSRVMQDQTEALRHWEALYALGLESRFEYSNLLLRLAGLHQRQGRPREALRYFKEFDAEFPVDRRTGLVRDWIVALEEETR